MSDMNFIDRFIDAWTPARLARAADTAVNNARPAIMPPPRSGPTRTLTTDKALTVPSIYRAAHILATAAGQLSINVERGGETLTQTPPLIRRPNVDMSRSEFIEQVVLSMALTGNAFILKHTTAAGEVFNLEVLNPHHVAVTQDSTTGRLTYHFDGTEYTRARIQHLKLIPAPGRLLGSGPIQAAQASAAATLDMRDYMSRWFSDTGQPTGVLTSDQVLSGDDAKQYRNAWNGLDTDGSPLPDTDNPSGIRVLGKGTTYEPILIKPKDALWLEAQSWTTLEVARVFGVPSSLMLTAIEGNSQTYSNVEQEWLGFTRFTLLSYLRKIEEALTEFTPRGQTVRFNIETLLRTDTRSRYEAHKIAIESGFLTVNEVREIEGLPPLETPTYTAPAERTTE